MKHAEQFIDVFFNDTKYPALNASKFFPAPHKVVVQSCAWSLEAEGPMQQQPIEVEPLLGYAQLGQVRETTNYMFHMIWHHVCQHLKAPDYDLRSSRSRDLRPLVRGAANDKWVRVILNFDPGGEGGRVHFMFYFF